MPDAQRVDPFALAALGEVRRIIGSA
jgi:hypothetical protein